MATKTRLHQFSSRQYQGGFGLIELMVSIGIMVMVLTVVMVRQSAFNGASLLRDQAYVVALEARNVQLQAVSAERSTVSFRNVYGLFFSTPTTRTSIYKLFRDTPGSINYYFDSGEEQGKQGKLDGRFIIDEIRFIGPTNTIETDVSITFERPNFDAKIYTGSTAANPSVSGVEIDIRVKGTTGPGANKVRTLEITRTGQITVKTI